MRFHHDHDDAFLEPQFETRAALTAPNTDAVAELAHDNSNLRAALRKQQDEMEAKDRQLVAAMEGLAEIKTEIGLLRPIIVSQLEDRDKRLAEQEDQIGMLACLAAERAEDRGVLIRSLEEKDREIATLRGTIGQLQRAIQRYLTYTGGNIEILRMEDTPPSTV